MKKSDLSSHVASQASLSKAAADNVVNTVFSAISDALAKGETVAIAGFGTFTTKARAARQGAQSPHRRTHRNPGFEGAFVQGCEGASRRRGLTSRTEAHSATAPDRRSSLALMAVILVPCTDRAESRPDESVEIR